MSKYYKMSKFNADLIQAQSAEVLMETVDGIYTGMIKAELKGKKYTSKAAIRRMASLDFILQTVASRSDSEPSPVWANVERVAQLCRSRLLPLIPAGSTKFIVLF